MIIGSLNIRGGGNALKRRRISSLVIKSKDDIFFIQETKLTSMHDFMAKSFWNAKDIGFSFSNSTGRSGGLLTLWNGDAVDVLLSFKGEGYLGVKVCKNNNFFYLINVYSSCKLVKKRMLWRKLLELKDVFNDGEWIIGGDFNTIKVREERKGRGAISNIYEVIEFAEFIEKSLLVDVPCKGKNLLGIAVMVNR
ncbi:uncharacterized protein LOC131657978 [Vicia villosa]|uniref:uncharacterized protein LOC131657978 n=1 Tax=Vicia villosa TaxID=3911 RepID=UPI00273B7F3F|nr:uncharacterized protein LOC131657978 [Vicia villosa]